MHHEPVIVVLMGLPGSGKSTLARALAEYSGMAVVDRDAIRAAMFPQGDCGDDERSAATDATWAAVRTHARLRRSCIVDGMSFAERAARDCARGLALSFGLSFVPVLLECPVNEAVRRVAAQPGHPARDRNGALVKRLARSFEPVTPGTLVLDALEPVEELLASVAARLPEERRRSA